jgi:hypothetical protein
MVMGYELSYFSSAMVCMMDDNVLKTISKEARDEYIRLALAVTKTARELRKPLSELDPDKLGVHLEEIKEAAPFIDMLPRKITDDVAEEEKSPEGEMTREELNGMVVTVVQNVVVQVGFLIHNLLTGDLEDLENLGLRLE